MPRSSEVTRKQILDAAYRLFRRQGYTRVSIDEIMRLAKLTKKTFYYHFKSKDALLASVLETQSELALAAFRTLALKLDGSPTAIVDTLFAELKVWADKPRWAGSGFTRLVIELADLPGHPARKIAHRHKSEVERHFTELLADAGAPSPKETAREIWLLSEGAISMILVHGDSSYAAAAAKAARKLLDASLKRRPAVGAPRRTVNATAV